MLVVAVVLAHAGKPPIVCTADTTAGAHWPNVRATYRNVAQASQQTLHPIVHYHHGHPFSPHDHGDDDDTVPSDLWHPSSRTRRSVLGTPPVPTRHFPFGSLTIVGTPSYDVRTTLYEAYQYLSMLYTVAPTDPRIDFVVTINATPPVDSPDIIGQWSPDTGIFGKISPREMYGCLVLLYAVVGRPVG